MQEAINSCWEDDPSAEALCWEDTAGVIKVIALEQQALLGREEARLSFGFHCGGWRSLLKRELEGSRGSPGNRENSQPGLRGVGFLSLLYQTVTLSSPFRSCLSFRFTVAPIPNRGLELRWIMQISREDRSSKDCGKITRQEYK